MYKCYKCAKNGTCAVYKRFNPLAAQMMDGTSFNCDSYESRSCDNCLYSDLKISSEPCNSCNELYNKWRIKE